MSIIYEPYLTYSATWPSILHGNDYWHLGAGRTTRERVSELPDSQTQTGPCYSPSGFMSSLLVLLLQRGYADRGDFWASWQGFPHSSFFSGQVQRKTERKDGVTTRTSPEELTPGIWMQSRWDPDTHPSLTLSCSALWTLHLDIFVYSFENILALMDGAFKYIHRNIF